MRMALYLAKRPMLLDYAYRMLGSREVAEEVVQEAFIRFVPPSPAESEKLPSASYLFRIVHNLALDIIRREKIECTQIGDDAPFWTRPQDEPSPEEALLHCEKVRRTIEMMAQLPEDQRTALQMHRFGNYTLEQIGVHLDVSVSTAHRLVRSALASLAMQLDSEDL